MRKTLTEEFCIDVESATERSNPKWLKRGNIILHSKFVRKSNSKMRNNKVLNARPPVSESKKKLPRSTRVKLAQQRSGYSKLLNSYMPRIYPEVHDVCPHCQESPHDRKHLFECKKKPKTHPPHDRQLMVNACQGRILPRALKAYLPTPKLTPDGYNNNK